MMYPLLAAALAMASLSAQASPVTIQSPFLNFENRGENSLGYTTGAYLRIGANSVLPNGAGGTTGSATRLDPVTLQPVSAPREVFFSGGPVSPNFFSRVIPIAPTNHDPWALKFVNGTDSASVQLQLQPDAAVVDFVKTITLSGSGANPTFTWTPPANTHVDGYRINIVDKSVVTSANDGTVVSVPLQPGQTSFTVDNQYFKIDGYTEFKKDTKYSIEISLIQTKDGSSTNLGNANVKSISRVYADFTRKVDGGPAVNLPVVRIDGSYKFNMAVEAGKVYYIDPDVAVGYDYAVGVGNPNFRSVLLPLGVGDGLFDIWGFDSFGQLVLLADDWGGGIPFDFGANGVNRFRVTGIESDAGLDPGNPTAFITGVSFVGDGDFTGTQTPIVQSVAAIPEPGSLVLVGAAVAGWFVTRRRKSGSVDGLSMVV